MSTILKVSYNTLKDLNYFEENCYLYLGDKIPKDLIHKIESFLLCDDKGFKYYKSQYIKLRTEANKDIRLAKAIHIIIRDLNSIVANSYMYQGEFEDSNNEYIKSQYKYKVCTTISILKALLYSMVLLYKNNINEVTYVVDKGLHVKKSNEEYKSNVTNYTPLSIFSIFFRNIEKQLSSCYKELCYFYKEVVDRFSYQGCDHSDLKFNPSEFNIEYFDYGKYFNSLKGNDLGDLSVILMTDQLNMYVKDAYGTLIESSNLFAGHILRIINYSTEDIAFRIFLNTVDILTYNMILPVLAFDLFYSYHVLSQCLFVYVDYIHVISELKNIIDQNVNYYTIERNFEVVFTQTYHQSDIDSGTYTFASEPYAEGQYSSYIAKSHVEDTLFSRATNYRLFTVDLSKLIYSQVLQYETLKDDDNPIIEEVVGSQDTVFGLNISPSKTTLFSKEDYKSIVDYINKGLCRKGFIKEECRFILLGSDSLNYGSFLLTDILCKDYSITISKQMPALNTHKDYFNVNTLIVEDPNKIEAYIYVPYLQFLHSGINKVPSGYFSQKYYGNNLMASLNILYSTLSMEDNVTTHPGIMDTSDINHIRSTNDEEVKYKRDLEGKIKMNTYTIPHIRKLPKSTDYASPEKIAEAKRYGFNLQRGYTFVNGFVRSLYVDPNHNNVTTTATLSSNVDFDDFRGNQTEDNIANINSIGFGKK